MVWCIFCFSKHYNGNNMKNLLSVIWKIKSILILIKACRKGYFGLVVTRLFKKLVFNDDFVKFIKNSKNKACTNVSYFFSWSNSRLASDIWIHIFFELNVISWPNQSFPPKSSKFWKVHFVKEENFLKSSSFRLSTWNFFGQVNLTMCLRTK